MSRPSRPTLWCLFLSSVVLPTTVSAQEAVTSQGCTVRQLTDDRQYALANVGIDFAGSRIVVEAGIHSTENLDGSTEVFVLDRITGELRQVSHVTYPPNHARYPAISGDGRTIAYQVDGATPLEWYEELRLHDLKTNLVTPLSPTTAPTTYWPALNGDGSRVVFESSEDLAGENPHGREEVFLYDAKSSRFTQVTPIGGSANGRARIDFAGTRVVFDSYENLTGGNPFYRNQVFVFDAPIGSIRQITDGSDYADVGPPDISGNGRYVVIPSNGSIVAHDLARGLTTPLLESVQAAGALATSFDGSRTAFLSAADPFGDNEDQSLEIFLYDSATDHLQQVTRSDFNSTYGLDLSGAGDAIAFLFNANPTGDNPDRSTELFVADCPLGPPRPEGPAITSPAVPDFAFHVRISGGSGQSIYGAAELSCIPETLCVSGALPGRSEVFLRVVGPKPNGFLWPTLVKFSTSTVEVWAEQLSTGLVRYYRLEGATPGRDELPGSFDRDGFLPPADGTSAPATLVGGATTPPPPEKVFTSEHYPDFRFRARISSGDQVQ